MPKNRKKLSYDMPMDIWEKLRDLNIAYIQSGGKVGRHPNKKGFLDEIVEGNLRLLVEEEHSKLKGRETNDG